MAIITGAVPGIIMGVLVPILSNKLIESKEKKKNKEYDKWNMSKIKKLGYISGTIIMWIGLACLYPGWKLLYIGVVLTAAVVAAYIDSKCRILPNEIVFSIAIAGLLYQFLSAGIAGVGKGVLAMLLGGGIFFLAGFLTRKAGAVGAGDVKYIMAAGMMVGFPGILDCLLFMVAGLGIYCVGGILLKKLTVYSYFAMGVFISFGLVMSFFAELVFLVVESVLV